MWSGSRAIRQLAEKGVARAAKRGEQYTAVRRGSLPVTQSRVQVVARAPELSRVKNNDAALSVIPGNQAEGRAAHHEVRGPGAPKKLPPQGAALRLAGSNPY